MHGFSGWSAFEFCNSFFVRENVFEQLFQRLIVKTADNFHQLGEHFIYVIFCRRKVIRQIVFIVFAGADAMHGQLQAIAVKNDQATRKDNIINFKCFSRLFKIIPPMPNNLAGAICQRQGQVLSATFFIAKFFRFDQKISTDGLVSGEIADKYFHKNWRSVISAQFPLAWQFLYPFVVVLFLFSHVSVYAFFPSRFLR